MTIKDLLRQISVEPVMLLGSAIFITHQVGLPQLLVSNTCKTRFNDTFCQNLAAHPAQENEIQQESAVGIVKLYGASYFVAVCLIFFIGSLADKRKKSRLMSCIPIIAGLQSSVYLAVSLGWKTFPPWILLFGSIWTGFYGELQGIILLCSAYYSRTIPVAERSIRFLVLECTVFAGFALATLSTGYFIDKLGFPSIFIFTLVLSVANFLYIRIHLWNEEDSELEAETKRESFCPEGISKNYDMELKSSGNSMICGSLVNIFKPEIRMHLFLLLSVLTLALMALIPEPSIETLYLKRHPFDFSASKLGITFLVQNMGRALGASALNFLLNVRFHCSDIFSVCLGLVTLGAFYLAMGLVKEPKAVIPLQLLSIGSPLITAGLRSMISKIVDPSQCGAAFGVVESLDAATAFVSMVVVNGVYATSISYDSRIPFYFLSGNALLGFLILLVYKLLYGKEVKHELYSQL